MNRGSSLRYGTPNEEGNVIGCHYSLSLVQKGGSESSQENESPSHSQGDKDLNQGLNLPGSWTQFNS